MTLHRRRIARAAAAFALAAITCGLAGPAVAAKKKPAPEPLPAIETPYLLVEAGTGRVLAERDAMRPWYPASTSKLMTIYVAFRAVAAGEIKLDSQIDYTNAAAAEPASKMGFRVGTTLTLEDALRMMMVKSANDIAVAVAEAVGGSVDGFAERMNAESARLGMARSHWVNPHGLPDERQVTSARDMAVLASALLTEFPQYRDFFAMPAIQLGDIVLKNFNSLLERYPNTTGMKTGFICASGYNLVGSARRGNRELIAVVFGALGGRARAEQAAELLDEGFAMPPSGYVPAPGSYAPIPVAAPSLATVTSGASYTAPFDMRPYVCGARRVTVASEANDDGAEGAAGAQSHLTAEPILLGPPIRVSAVQPAYYGEPGFVAPLPRPRPGWQSDLLDAYTADPGETPSAAAIGAAAGSPSGLRGVTSQP